MSTCILVIPLQEGGCIAELALPPCPSMLQGVKSTWINMSPHTPDPQSSQSPCLSVRSVVVQPLECNASTSVRPALNKGEGSRGGLRAGSCCCRSLSLQPPLCSHIRASRSLYRHPHMTPTCMHTHSLSDTHTHEPTSMGSRVTPVPCFIKGAVTIGLLLLWQQPGHNRSECGGLLPPRFSETLPSWQRGQTETGQHVIRGWPWRWETFGWIIYGSVLVCLDPALFSHSNKVPGVWTDLKDKLWWIWHSIFSFSK